MRKLWKGIAVMTCTLLYLPLVALADETKDTEAGRQQEQAAVYDGGSYTILPPPKWFHISGSLGDRELAKLPDSVREHYNQRNADVLYMNIESLETVTQGFKDSLNIVTINEAIPLTPDFIKEFSTVLQQQYTAMFEQFQMQSFELKKLQGREVLELSGSYMIQNYSVKMTQTFVPATNESLLFTCTYEASREAEIKALCQTALESLKFKKQDAAKP